MFNVMRTTGFNLKKNIKLTSAQLTQYNALKKQKY